MSDNEQTNFQNNEVTAPKKDRRNKLPVKLKSLKWRSLGSRLQAVIVIALVAVVGVGATLYTNAQQVNEEGTVILSNGQEVRLDEPVSELIGTVPVYGTNDLMLFVYPKSAAATKPEAFIYADGKKVTAIHIIGGEQNRLKQSEDRIGQRFNGLNARAKGRLQAIDQLSDSVKRPGYKTQLSRSTRYLLTEPCGTDDQFTSIALVLNGQPSRIPASRLEDCNKDTD